MYDHDEDKADIKLLVNRIMNWFEVTEPDAMDVLAGWIRHRAYEMRQILTRKEESERLFREEVGKYEKYERQIQQGSSTMAKK